MMGFPKSSFLDTKKGGLTKGEKERKNNVKEKEDS